MTFVVAKQDEGVTHFVPEITRNFPEIRQVSFSIYQQYDAIDSLDFIANVKFSYTPPEN